MSATIHLSSRQRATLDAAARIVVPHAFGGDGAAAGADTGLVARLEGRLATMPLELARDLARALDALDSRLAGALIAGTLTPFSRLAPDERSRAFEQWSRSRIPIARTVFQAVRRLVLLVHYVAPNVQRDVGISAPLGERDAVHEGEGAVAGGVTSDEEPVARALIASRPYAHRAAILDSPSRHAAIFTGADLSGEIHLTADVVVIGSGAGGGVAAARLAAAGREVVIVEEGSYLTAGDFSEHEDEMVPRLFADQGLRSTDDQSIGMLQGAVVGGGTTVNWMVMLRTPDHVLDEWATRHGAVGMSAAEMAPIFDQVEREVHARRVPDDAHSPSNRALIVGAERLGWHATPALINARGCMRAGTCSLGCRYGAKQGVLLTYLPQALASGARLYANARVERIEVAERYGRDATPALKRVSATVRDPTTGAVRASLTISAPVVVLAAGAVGTPALLHRSGLGGGAVGHWLRLHPTTVVMGRYAHETHPVSGLPLSAVCDEFLRRDENGYGFWLECPALTPGLAAVALGGFGEAHQRDMASLGHTASFIALTRDGADRDRSSGSVTLDRRGRTHINYRLGSQDTGHVVASIEAAARIHLAAGAREVITLHSRPVRMTTERDIAEIRTRSHAPNDLALFSAHVNGTCRLGTDPRTSGATPDGERHGVRGLYVLDGSLLPTALGVNPQVTIMALATVLSARIVARG